MMESNIKVSIIMPSLNVGEYIEECIESVVNQSLNEIEIICIDAGSSDRTLEILEKYAKNDNRIKLIHSDKKSYGYQVNLGIDNSNGEYIGIVETDDYIDEKMYETLYNLTNNASFDIAKANFCCFYDENGRKFRNDDSKSNLIENKEFTIYGDANFLVGHPSIWGGIYKKSFLKQNNITFMEVPGGGWVDNPFLYETALCAKSIIYSNESLYYYRESNPNSSTNNMVDVTLPMKRMLDVLDVLDKYSCNDENILKQVYQRIFNHIHEIMILNLENQRHEAFIYINKVCIRLDESIVSKHMTILDKFIYSKFSSNFNENSLSTKFLAFLVKLIDNIIDNKKKSQYQSS